MRVCSSQLGAHVALSGLKNAITDNIEARVRQVGNRLKSDLSRIAERSPLLKEIRGEGLHLHLVLDIETFPLSLFGKTVSELLISCLSFSRGHVLLFFCRLLPPLNITDAEVRELVTRIEKTVEISRFSLFGLARVFAFLYLLLMARLESVARRLIRQVVRFGI